MMKNNEQPPGCSWFENGKVLKISAPMVRYSKLPFRKLVRKYDADLVYTPMLLANSFARSQKGRDANFCSDSEDRPLIVQFAASDPVDMIKATEFVVPYSDGVDVNCGCPQKWAIKEGIGCALIRQPQLVADIVKGVRNTVSESNFTVSIKIRIHDDLRTTVELCRRAQAAGVSFISVHGRTAKQRKEPVNVEAIALIKSSLDIPVVANGDIKSLADLESVAAATGVDGVMVARGLLHNPALFAGHEITPLQCVKDWIDIAMDCGVHFSNFHHHLMFMMDAHLRKAEKRVFCRLQSIPAVLDYLHDRYDLFASDFVDQ